MSAGVRVVTSPEAQQAASQVNAIVNGGLTDTIGQLGTQLDLLADPGFWDGPQAARYRGQVHGQTKHAMRQMHDALQELQREVAQINQAIAAAGS